MERLAFSTQISSARRISLALALRPTSDNQRDISDLMKAVAMPLAISPALYPPMPSASTHSCVPSSTTTASSLFSRARPGSVLVQKL